MKKITYFITIVFIFILGMNSIHSKELLRLYAGYDILLNESELSCTELTKFLTKAGQGNVAVDSNACDDNVLLKSEFSMEFSAVASIHFSTWTYPFLLIYDTDKKEYSVAPYVGGKSSDYATYKNQMTEDEYKKNYPNIISYKGLYFDRSITKTDIGGLVKYENYLNTDPKLELTSDSGLGIYYCVNEAFWSWNYATARIYYDEIHAEDVQSSKDINNGQCGFMESIELYTGELNKTVQSSQCISYTRLFRDIESYYVKYQTKDNVKYLNDANKEIEKVRALCKAITQYSDYSSPCLSKCISYKEDLDNLKNKYGMQVEGEGKCGFSWDLINFIANIIKWIKYIVPVLVIVLGIIDFIKAISADKDDEMKKAQGKFVKRLVAAALIFITPIIIEFILNIIGFDANGCGIIDL